MRYYAEALSTPIDGENKRFCQKCTRFHTVDAFDGTHRTCAAALLKRQQKAKRPRKIKEQETTTMQGMKGPRATQPDVKKEAAVGKVSKRHRTAKTPADTAATAAVFTGSLDPRRHDSDIPAVTGALLCPFGDTIEPTTKMSQQSNIHTIPRASTSQKCVTKLMDDVVDDISEESELWPTDVMFADIEMRAQDQSHRNDAGFLKPPLLAYTNVNQAKSGWMDSVEHHHHQQQQQQAIYHEEQQQQLLRFHQHQRHILDKSQERQSQHDIGGGVDGDRHGGEGDGGGDGWGTGDSGCSGYGSGSRGGDSGGNFGGGGFESNESLHYERFLQAVSSLDTATDEDRFNERAPTTHNLWQAAGVSMQQPTPVARHSRSNTNLQMGPTISIHDGAQTSTGVSYEEQMHPPGHGFRNSDTLDALTLWAKLDGFSPSHFPIEGLAPELERWLGDKIPASVSGHIQPGCTLLTVDFLLTLDDASQIRADGVHVIAELLLAGPLVGVGISQVDPELNELLISTFRRLDLNCGHMIQTSTSNSTLCPYIQGKRGNVTVGMGAEALICVADRDAATGNIFPGRFSQRIPLDAAALMPGGAKAATACAANLISRSRENHNQSHKLDAQCIKVFPSCVFTGDDHPDLGNQSSWNNTGTSAAAAVAAATSTIRITFPAAALPGCALRCRANGCSLSISIVSAHRDSTASSALHCEMEAEMVTLVVKIVAPGVDGVAMLELVRSSSHEPGGPGLEQPLLPHLYALYGAGKVNDDDLVGDDRFVRNLHNLSGVPAGLPATPVLLVSDHEVLAALEDILASNGEGEAQSDLRRHSSTLYAIGVTVLRGTAPLRQALQFVCLAASKGQLGRALRLRLLDMYPAVSIIASEEDAASVLLHAVASNDMETVLAALYSCREAAEARGFDASELASFPAGADRETPLHRAAAMHECGGDADVMFELLATLAKPLAWSMGSCSRGRLTLIGSTVLVEAIAQATSTLVCVVQQYPGCTIEACTSAAATEIIEEAVSKCPFPVGATPQESVRAAMTLEILCCASSATRLLNIVAHLDAIRAATADVTSIVSAGSSSNNLLSSQQFVAGSIPSNFVAVVSKSWSMSRCGRMVEEHALGSFASAWAWEIAVGGMRRVRSGMSLILRHGPNGAGNLFFDFEPDLERQWMDYWTRAQVTVDHLAFTFILLIQIITLFRLHLLPLMRSTGEQTHGATGAELVHQLLAPVYSLFIFIFIKRNPAWYRRHRETIIFMSRLGFSLFPVAELFQVKTASTLRRNTLFITLNLTPIFYSIRADRHLIVQITNTLLWIWLLDLGGTYTVANLPLRSVLAGASLVIMLLLESHSRCAFVLKHGRTQAREKHL